MLTQHMFKVGVLEPLEEFGRTWQDWVENWPRLAQCGQDLANIWPSVCHILADVRHSRPNFDRIWDPGATVAQLGAPLTEFGPTSAKLGVEPGEVGTKTVFPTKLLRRAYGGLCRHDGRLRQPHGGRLCRPPAWHVYKSDLCVDPLRRPPTWPPSPACAHRLRPPPAPPACATCLRRPPVPPASAVSPVPTPTTTTTSCTRQATETAATSRREGAGALQNRLVHGQGKPRDRAGRFCVLVSSHVTLRVGCKGLCFDVRAEQKLHLAFVGEWICAPSAEPGKEGFRQCPTPGMGPRSRRGCGPWKQYIEEDPGKPRDSRLPNFELSRIPCLLL